MDLTEVRQRIDTVDNQMKELFNNRMECSKEVARVKLETGDDVFKPLREKEILEKFSTDSQYKSFIKKVMQISRKYQYGLFASAGNIDEDYLNQMSMADRVVFKKGGIMNFKLKEDKHSERGLNLKDILAVISDTNLDIVNLNADESEIIINLRVPDTESSKKEAMVLGYMLYMETKNN